MKEIALPSIILINPDSQSEVDATRFDPVIQGEVELGRVDGGGKNMEIYQPNGQVWIPEDSVETNGTDETDEFDAVV